MFARHRMSQPARPRPDTVGANRHDAAATSLFRRLSNRLLPQRLRPMLTRACLCLSPRLAADGKDNQFPLKPFGQSLADRALITHPFFGPTFALCPAHQSVSTFTNSMVPTYKGGSHHHDASSIEQEALSFAPKDPPEAEQAHVNDFNSFRSLRRDCLATGNSQRHLRARG